MNNNIIAIAKALDDLALSVINSYAGDSTCTEVWGWNCPSLTRHDLAGYPEKIAKKIREADIEDVPSEIQPSIDSILKKIAIIQSNIVPQIFSGNCAAATTAYLESLDGIRLILEPLTSWENVDTKTMPSSISRRLKALKIQADDIEVDKNELNAKLKLINDTYEAADALPVNLDELRQAQFKLSKSNEDATLIMGKINEKNAEAEQAIDKLKLIRDEAQKLIEKCEEAYQITTTKGLAGAFDIKAKSLSASIIFWVVGLISALSIGALIASSILHSLVSTLSSTNPNWGIIAIDIIIAILSVGAPAWFSWIATKQIGQRFRLAEDYAYKASVAKAYEGYRKEAARIDPAFESRLFSSALSRLEEAPLRLIEQEAHGSPWHELANSSAFNNAFGLSSAKTYVEEKLSVNKNKPKVIEAEE